LIAKLTILRNIEFSSFNEGLEGNSDPNPERKWVIEGCENDDMSSMNPIK